MGKYMHLYKSESEHVAFAKSSNYVEPYVGAIEFGNKPYVHYNLSWDPNPSHGGQELPYDAEIEYLQSSGSQYIQLNVSASAGQYFGISGEMIALQPNTNKYTIFGANPNAQFHTEFYSVSSSVITWSSTVGNNASSGGWSTKVGEKQYFELSTEGRTQQGVFSALKRNLTAAITQFRIFGGYANTNRYPLKLCNFKITVGDSVKYDLIPVRKGTVGYMYDKISGTLYGNNGSGSFTLGPDIDTSTLPYDTEVEYLQTSGTSWLQLPIVPNDGTDAIEVGFRFTTATRQMRIFNATSSVFQAYINGSDAMAYNTKTTSNGDSWTGLNSTYNKVGVVDHVIKCDYKNNKVYYDFDPYTMPTRKVSAGSGNLLVGSKYGSNPAYSGRIYYVKFWRNNELLYDMIPVKKDGVGYFYNKIDKELYANAGTAAWTVGYDKIKNLSKYTRLNYIENTTFTATSPYIDCKLDSSIRPYKFEATLQWNVSGSSKRQLFGANGTNAAFWGNENGVYKVQNSRTLAETPSTTEFQTINTGDITSTPSAPFGSMSLFRIYEPANKLNTTTTFIASCKLKNYKIWQGGTLVRDYVAVLHPSGRYGLFDKVENKFYDSANSGSFTGG